MSNNLVIVAIPDQNDRVWKVSSEKVPHLTLLFLGDETQVQNLDVITQFVEHAVNIGGIRRFYLPVERRGELGDDPETGPADVLFFRQRGYDFKAIRDFREQLLQEPNIKTAFDSADQYDTWTPHLTMGYQSTPAKPDNSDYPSFYDVSFDRIAVWTGDYAGPEFVLKDYWDDMDVEGIAGPLAMSANDARAAMGMQFLTHKSVTPKSVLDKPANRTKIKAKVQALLAAVDDTTGTDPDGAIRARLNSLLDDFTGDKDRDLAQSAIAEALVEGVGFENALIHYGVKGMKWGVRKDDRAGFNSTGAGETKRTGIQRYLDPQGHSLGTDVAKVAVGILVPVVAPATWPAQVRVVRGLVRDTKARSVTKEQERFAKNAMSVKNFVGINNTAATRINREIDGINAKYPGDLTKDPKRHEQYNKEAIGMMQSAYREAANSMGNKTGTHHLDLEFFNDGLDFKIHAREGAPTPVSKRITHAAGDGTAELAIEISGKFQRDATGHIVGITLDGFDPATAQHTIDLGAEFLAHYGVKGMRWGVRKEQPVTTSVHVDTGVRRRQTQVRAEGGVSHPAHHDAVKAAVAKQIIKKSGTDALSTQELRDLANRLQVEGQVHVLMSSKGKQFVAKQLENEGKQALTKGAKSAARKAAPHVVKRAAKGAATVATTAALA